MSEFLKLGWSDLGKGVLVAFLTVFIGGLMTSLNAGAFPTGEQLQSLLLPAGAAGLSYLLKNLFTNSENKLLASEPPKS